MIYVWIIENKLAQGPFPSYSLINDYARIFDAFVVLVMPHEIPGGLNYYLELLSSYGLEVYYAPTPDLHPVELLVLHDISLFIDNIINNRGGKVFVHCMGGIGRSGTVTAAYLIYSGKSFLDAINTVRSKVVGAVEVFGQWRILEDYYILYRNVSKSMLDTIVKFHRAFTEENSLKHVSKIIQLSIELAGTLNTSIQYDNLILISFLYEILRENKNKINLFKEYLGKPINKKIVDDATVLLENVSSGSIKFDELEDQVLLMYLSVILDYYRDQRVVVTDHSIMGDKIVITLYCDYDCSKLIEMSEPIIREFEKRKGIRITLVGQSYMESI